MTERKPPRVSWETWSERQIRRTMDDGGFDRLQGAGKPLPGLERPRDDEWWIKQKLEREKLSTLPPALALRKEVDDARARIAAARSEREVRQIVAAINARIAAVNATLIEGPPSTSAPLDVERVLRSWRDRG